MSRVLVALITAVYMLGAVATYPTIQRTACGETGFKPQAVSVVGAATWPLTVLVVGFLEVVYDHRTKVSRPCPKEPTYGKA